MTFTRPPWSSVCDCGPDFICDFASPTEKLETLVSGVPLKVPDTATTRFERPGGQV